MKGNFWCDLSNVCTHMYMCPCMPSHSTDCPHPRPTRGSRQGASTPSPPRRRTATSSRWRRRRWRAACAPSPGWTRSSSLSVCSSNTASTILLGSILCWSSAGPTLPRVRIAATCKGTGECGQLTGRLAVMGYMHDGYVHGGYVHDGYVHDGYMHDGYVHDAYPPSACN